MAPGKPRPLCDGQTRRQFLRIGGLAAGGLALPGLIGAEAAAGVGSSHKSVIMIFLVGGPSHIDTVDMKPDAPAEIRGEFKPIPTSVPGIEVCELMPGIARIMDKLAIVRSLTGAADQHLSDYCVSGFPMLPNGERQAGRPALGPVASALLGPVDSAVPAFVGFAPPNTIGANVGESAFLGADHDAFRPDQAAADVLDPGRQGLTLERLGGRRTLLGGFDAWRRAVDATGALDKHEASTRRAFEILTSRKVADALDLSKEDPRLVAKYGRGDPPNDPAYAPYYMDQFLLARRLVEAGVRVVTISFGLWDTHSSNFTDIRGHGLRYSLPRLDQGLTALVEDLHHRGLQDDVSVVVWGEFGRTPRINKDAGRDHWPKACCAIMAGGGMTMGQAVGSTTKYADAPRERPLTYHDLLATLYHNLGIDARAQLLRDRLNRPLAALDAGEVIGELVGRS